jgi:hypothetical protein
MPKDNIKVIELWHKDGNVVGAETKVYRNGELANTKGKYEHLFINNITMPKDNQEKEVDFLLKATGNGGATTQSEFMPKDYQEEKPEPYEPLFNHEERFKEKLTTICFAYEEKTGVSVVEEMMEALTTYGNAREQNKVEEIIKIVEHDKEMTGCYEGCKCRSRLIKAIKK